MIPTPPFRSFGTDRMRFNVVCKEPPGVVVYTDPAEEDEGELNTVLDGNYGAKTLDLNERIHYGDLKDRYRQRRDRTRQLVAQLATLNTRNKQKSAFWPKRCPRRISRSIASLKRSLLLFATSRTCRRLKN